MSFSEICDCIVEIECGKTAHPIAVVQQPATMIVAVERFTEQHAGLKLSTAGNDQSHTDVIVKNLGAKGFKEAVQRVLRRRIR